MALKVGELYATLQLDDSKFSKTLDAIASNFNKMVGKVEASMDDVVDAFGDAEDAVDSFEDRTDKVKPAKIPAPDTSNFDKTLKNVAQKMEDVGKKMTTLVTAPIVGVGASATVTGMKFEQAMANVQAITSATGDDFKALEEKAKEMGASTKFSASQSADAMSYLGMAGWDTTQILSGIEPVLKLSIASGSELATVADIVSDALTGFGMSAEETGRFTDILAQVSRKANTNVEILGESFKYSSSLMGSMGYTAEDTAVALGLMANAGIKGSSAGTALSGAISRMIDPTKEVKDLMDKYGISLTDTDGNMLSLGQVMENLREKLGGLDTATRNQVVTQLFGQEAMKGMLPIISASDEAYNELKDSIYGSNGASQEMADIMGNTLQGRVDSMKSAIEGGLINVFEQLKPTIEKVIEKITEFGTWLAEADEETINHIVTLAGLVAAVGPVLTIVGKLIKVFMSVKSGLTIAKGALMAWTGASTLAGAASTILAGAIAFLTSPIGIVIAVIAGLVAAGVALWKNWDWVKEKAGELASWLGTKWEEIKTKCLEVWDNISTYLTEKWESIKTAVSDCWNKISDFLSGAWDTICNIVEVGIMLIEEILKGAFQILILPFSFIWENFGDVLTEKWNEFTSYLKGKWDEIVGKLKEIFGPIVEYFSKLWTDVSTKTKELWNGVKTWLSDSWNSIKTKCSESWNGMKTTISNKWNEIKTNTSERWNNIKSDLSSKWESVKSTASEKFNSVKSTVSGVWDNMKSTASSKWDSIKTTISDKWESIKTTVKNGVDKLKGFMNFHWELPKLKMPHFKISGKFSLNPPSVPSFGIEWYKRGGMFDSPTVVGLGEAGREGIVPFSGMSNKSLASELAQLFADAGGFGGGSGVVVEQMVVRDDTDIVKIAQELDRLQRRNGRGRK